MTNDRYLSPLIWVLFSIALSSCATDKHGTIAELETVNLALEDTHIDGGLEKAMQSYQKFLEQTPDSAMTPEAIRRLADLKVEKEYGAITDNEPLTAVKELSAPKIATQTNPLETHKDSPSPKGSTDDKTNTESAKNFEQRTTQTGKIKNGKHNTSLALPKGEPTVDLQNKGASEAIVLYQKLLDKYPLYERNDQVFYQLSRAHEEIGQVEEAMKVMNRLVKQFPTSRYNDEVHFRRGEYYFTRKKFLDAEEAYGLVLKFGVGSVYYERALYKKGWTFYKQELFDEALHQFIALLDYKVSIGYDFEHPHNKIEKKRVEDTFRVISLSFSNLGGSESVKDYFAKNGSRHYESGVYENLAEFYFTKRRYSDAAKTYNSFVDSNPFHKMSPHFSMRVINIYKKGNFPRLVIEAKKQFSSTYGIQAEYWNYFEKEKYPKVLDYLKSNIMDLANHYHALYQNKRFKKDKNSNFKEASHWYREFLQSFPSSKESPGINFQLADLLMENKHFQFAAKEYERTSYEYPLHDKSSKAAYAAVYAYRQYVKVAAGAQIISVKRDIIRSSLALVDTFPKHNKVTQVLAAAIDDLFKMRDFVLAIKSGRRLINEYPKADEKFIRGAWLVVAHSSFDLEIFEDAEIAYLKVLHLTDEKDKAKHKLVDNLAASIYKQGEQAKSKEQYKIAVQHFLRIAPLAPHSKIRISAEYDAATVLIQIKDFEQAADVLLTFRNNFPRHELQFDITTKLAYVYKESKKYSLAAKEFEAIAAQSKELEIIREAMLSAADMYEKAKDTDNSLRIYHVFVTKFPKPIEFAIETHNKIALIYKKKEDVKNYHNSLNIIINQDKKAGKERTDRTRYLAATASLVLTELKVEAFYTLKLVNPLKRSMKKKQKLMKSLVKKFSKLVDYKVADVTAASTYYIAEIYFNFSRSLLESEKPTGLNALETEEFNLALEDQAYPFEEKSISIHEKNIELLTIGIYSKWIDQSITKLAALLPARYAKPEQTTGYIKNISIFRYLSQNYKKNLQKISPPAEIVTDQGVKSELDIKLPEMRSEAATQDGNSTKLGDAETSQTAEKRQQDLHTQGLN